MAGLADGSASLSMSGREELMTLKQTGCYSVSLSHNAHFIFYICRNSIKFC